MVIVAFYRDSERKYMGVATWEEAIRLAQVDGRVLMGLTLLRDTPLPVDVSMSTSCDQGEEGMHERSPL